MGTVWLACAFERLDATHLPRHESKACVVVECVMRRLLVPIASPVESETAKYATDLKAESLWGSTFPDLVGTALRCRLLVVQFPVVVVGALWCACSPEGVADRLEQG